MTSNKKQSIQNWEKEKVKEFDRNYICEWRWKREAPDKPSACDAISNLLKAQKEEFIKMVEGIVGENRKMGEIDKKTEEVNYWFGFNRRGTEIRKRIKDLLKELKENGQ